MRGTDGATDSFLSCGGGGAFAAQHADCVFVSGLPKEKTVERVRSIKEQAKAAGRDPADMRLIIMATVIVAPTEAEACDKHKELARYVDVEGMLALYSGLSGFDFSQNTLEAAKLAEARGVSTVIEGFTTANTHRVSRPADIANFGPQGGRECFIVGSPAQVADEMESWMAEAEIDGFNLQRSGEPQHIADFVDLAVPELQNRGIYKHAYPEGTFRQKLFGKGDRLPSGHPGARYRHRNP